MVVIFPLYDTDAKMHQKWSCANSFDFDCNKPVRAFPYILTLAPYCKLGDLGADMGAA